MNAKSLIGSLPIYAQHLAEQTGVKVRVEGTRAFYDGEVVNVPFTEDDLPLSFGFVAHECSHVRNTDMSVFQTVASTPFRKNLLNILEDIRIERVSMEQYPGTEEDIRYLNRKVLLEAYKPESVAQCPPLHVINNAVLFGGYWKLQEPSLEEPAKAYLAALEALLGKETADKIMLVVMDTLKCNSTQEVLALVDAIIALLPSPEDEQEQDPEPEPGEGEQDESQDEAGGGDDQQEQDSNEGEAKGDQGGSDDSSEEKADDEATGGGEEGDDDGKPDSEQKSSSGGKGQPSDDQQTQDGDGQGSDVQGKKPDQSNTQSDSSSDGHEAGDGRSPSGTHNLREQVLGATEKDLKGLISEVGDAAAELIGRQAARNPAPIRPFALEGRSKARSDPASHRRVQLGLEQSSGLRQCLNGLLQAQVDCRVRLKRQGKRIDTSRIAMIKTGETRVFRSKARAERQSAAIEILLDKSGSMSNSMDQAEAAVYAVLQALEGLPLVSTGAMAFPNHTDDGETRCALIKSPNERLVTAVQQGGFGASSQGNTPLAQALWPASVEVLRAKGERKILFVVTDGEPNVGTAPAVKEMIQRCEESGIEVIGLGFGDVNNHLLGQLFSHYIAVGSVSNLKTALFGVVREVLTA